ncbi:hypothetical protein chiPu_0021395 [Chiloscyllium punctatum]|uniref:Secreted protein n=1 Tax=Chiloscyllium punctatum TaxID=137246 RepID=A0A401REJ6_CHIPU|nr:hypothetical protein [Chiloscyllium punctatum]
MPRQLLDVSLPFLALRAVVRTVSGCEERAGALVDRRDAQTEIRTAARLFSHKREIQEARHFVFTAVCEFFNKNSTT